MKKETYSAARTRILNALKKADWTVKANLKRPVAIPPFYEFKLTFHAQAVYMNEYSMWIDIRGMDIAQFMLACAKQAKGVNPEALLITTLKTLDTAEDE